MKGFQEEGSFSQAHSDINRTGFSGLSEILGKYVCVRRSDLISSVDLESARGKVSFEACPSKWCVL